jgi:hypothetical protein
MTMPLRLAGSVGPAVMLALATPVSASGAPASLGQDAETSIGGVGVACTGIGGSKEEPRWRAYPLRIEFANDLREHLIGAQVRVTDETGREVMNVTCWGAWLLLKPPGDGAYTIEATIIGESVPAQKATVRAPASGQARIVLEFPGVDA